MGTTNMPFAPPGGVPLPGMAFNEDNGKAAYIVSMDMGTKRSEVAAAIVQDNNAAKVNLAIETYHASSIPEINLGPSEKSDTVLCYGKTTGVGPALLQKLIDNEEPGDFVSEFKMHLDVESRRKTEKDVKLRETMVTLRSFTG